MKYITKTNEIEAFQLTKMNTKGAAWPEWLVEAWNMPNKQKDGAFFSKIIYAPEGKHNRVQFYINIGIDDDLEEVDYGDYIIKDVSGVLKTVTAKYFKSVYEKITE